MRARHAESWLARIINSLLRLFFRLLYHEFAWTYDWVAAIVSVGNWKKWVLSVLPLLEQGPVLEIGHGPGHLQAALLRSQGAAFGLDASPQMGRLAARRLRKAGLTPRLSRANSQELPYRDCVFYSIVATFPSEYITDSCSLAEVWRTLIPGGQLVVLPFAWITGGRLVERTAGWLFRLSHQAPEIPASARIAEKCGSERFDLKKLGPWFRDFTVKAEKVGFQVHGNLQDLGNSVVLLVIAEKPVPAVGE
jgi:ubiquinone/menaquinone biosynthesis C-methylase UbiE